MTTTIIPRVLEGVHSTRENRGQRLVATISATTIHLSVCLSLSPALGAMRRGIGGAVVLNHIQVMKPDRMMIMTNAQRVVRLAMTTTRTRSGRTGDTKSVRTAIVLESVLKMEQKLTAKELRPGQEPRVREQRADTNQRMVAMLVVPMMIDNSPRFIRLV